MEPYITLVLAVRNEAKFIAATLGSIVLQTYPVEKMEILIADGMSGDATREIIDQFANKYSRWSIATIENPNKIVPTGINIAIREAKGDIIIRVDGHTTIAHDYVRQCVDALRKSGADNVGGRMDGVGTTAYGKAVALATSTLFGVGGGSFHSSRKREFVDTVYLGAWPITVFESIGLFDEELVRNQDDEFNYRLRAGGGKILLVPEIKSLYTVRSSPKPLWRQYYLYGYWKVRVLQKHPRQMSLRQFVPPGFVFGLLSSFLVMYILHNNFLFILLSIGYLISNITASLFLAGSKRDWQLLPYFPGIFSIIHLSYGLGFLIGLIDFWDRWGDKDGQVPNFQLKGRESK